MWVATRLKPLSANDSYLGKKVKSKKYKDYEASLLLGLPDLVIPEEGSLHLRMVVSYSNARSDIDNCLKPFIDVLQRRYGFNDSRIYKLTVKKQIVPKGDDSISFNLDKYEIKK